MKNVSKVLALIMIAAMLLTFAACGAAKNDKPADTTAAPVSNGSPLVGTWESNEAEGVVYTFNGDGTGTLKGDGYSMTLNYTDNGTSIDVSYNGGDEVQTQDYTINGDVLTLAGIGYTKVN
ncbi:MAG: hypothetical protein IJS94_08340 [Clostridia bacterium]|nr:hypothetical protein [Clostridia bacterium]